MAFCPNGSHFYAIFAKVSKTLIFLVNSFLGNFDRHFATFYWSHCLSREDQFDQVVVVCSLSDQCDQIGLF